MSKQRMIYYSVLTDLYKKFTFQFPEIDFVDMMEDRYGVRQVGLMSLEQINDLNELLLNELYLVA